MNIAGIDYESVKDGDGVRTVVYVSGCSHNCYNCHNPQTHDINYGVPFTEKLQNEIIENIKKRPFISGITWSGGDPLHENCLDDVLKFINKISLLLPNKTIWLYSGFTWDEVFSTKECYRQIDKLVEEDNNWSTLKDRYDNSNFIKRAKIISQCDIFIDGRYIDSQRNIQLKYRGSENQRVIDVQKSLKQNKIVLYCD